MSQSNEIDLKEVVKELVVESGKTVISLTEGEEKILREGVDGWKLGDFEIQTLKEPNPPGKLLYSKNKILKMFAQKQELDLKRQQKRLQQPVIMQEFIGFVNAFNQMRNQVDELTMRTAVLLSLLEDKGIATKSEIDKKIQNTTAQRVVSLCDSCIQAKDVCGRVGNKEETKTLSEFLPLVEGEKANAVVECKSYRKKE